MNTEALDLSIIAPALVAGLLVLATHVPLGAQVLRRGIVFIDLAIAQIAALGGIIAALLELETQPLWATSWLAHYVQPMQLAAALAALLGALLLTWTEKRWPEVQEAQIGVIFVLAASAGLLLLAHHPHGGEHLRDLLAGQILWVTYPQLLVPALIAGLIVSILLVFRGRLAGRAFYLVFALAVTVSVQLLGVYLVFASLIVPSLGVRNYPPAWRLPLAYLSAVLAYVAGLLGSLMFDLPAGALIVWSLFLLAVLSYALGSVRLALLARV